MKKTISLLLALTLVLSASCAFAFAEELTTEDYAYMDINEAPAELVDVILEARKTIIYQHSWTVDTEAYIENADGTVEYLPKFADLFPGWDVPTYETSFPLIMPFAIAGFEKNVYLYKTNVNATPFYYFNSDGSNVDAWAYTLPGTRCNIGFRNEDTGVDEAYIYSLAVGQPVHLKNPGYNVRYSVRASSFETEGFAYMMVYSV